MPRNAQNPANPYSAAIDDLSEFNLLVILEYIEHKGGPKMLASLSIGKIPGLLEVMYYIDHELSIGNRRSDAFDFFHIDRTTIQALSEDTQDLVYTLDDSEDNSDAESPGLPGCMQEAPTADLQPLDGTQALQAMPPAAQLAGYADEEETAAELPSITVISAWSLPALLFNCGAWNGPQGLSSFFQGSGANPFSM